MNKNKEPELIMEKAGNGIYYILDKSLPASCAILVLNSNTGEIKYCKDQHLDSIWKLFVEASQPDVAQEPASFVGCTLCGKVNVPFVCSQCAGEPVV